MNEINSEIVIANVIKLIDFSNPENNKKKKDNKKGALVKKIRNKKQSDLETQLCYILNNNLENRPIVIQQSQENLDVQRENIKLLKRVDELELELNKEIEISKKQRAWLQSDEELIKSLKDKIQTQINNIPTEPPPNFKPSTFDEEIDSSDEEYEYDEMSIEESDILPPITYQQKEDLKYHLISINSKKYFQKNIQDIHTEQELSYLYCKYFGEECKIQKDLNKGLRI